MNDKLLSQVAKDLGIISRALSFICINTPGMTGSSVGKQAKLLRAFGFSNDEVAKLLNTTPKTVSVRMAEENRKQPTKNRSKAKKPVVKG